MTDYEVTIRYNGTAKVFVSAGDATMARHAGQVAIADAIDTGCTLPDGYGNEDYIIHDIVVDVIHTEDTDVKEIDGE